jgi:hypothetical protein
MLCMLCQCIAFITSHKTCTYIVTYIVYLYEGHGEEYTLVVTM